jgi:hypothetical protein
MAAAADRAAIDNVRVESRSGESTNHRAAISNVAGARDDDGCGIDDAIRQYNELSLKCRRRIGWRTREGEVTLGSTDGELQPVKTADRVSHARASSRISATHNGGTDGLRRWRWLAARKGNDECEARNPQSAQWGKMSV